MTWFCEMRKFTTLAKNDWIFADISSNPAILNNNALTSANFFSWPPLSSLSVADSPHINDDTINMILPYFSQIKRMVLSRTDVSQAGLQRICRRWIFCEFSEKFRDNFDGLQRCRFTQLNYLEMRHLPRVYPRFLHELADTYPDVSTLILQSHKH